MTRIAVYDCTLRDGMQGEGMSLSAAEKLRVAHVLDDLGIPMIEAGFPASNPKEAELFEPLARQQLEELGLLRVRGREAGLDERHAELVEQVRDADLLAGGERHALTLHPVAQGAVVDRDAAHVAGAGAGRTSSHSA